MFWIACLLSARRCFPSQSVLRRKGATGAAKASGEPSYDVVQGAECQVQRWAGCAVKAFYGTKPTHDLSTISTGAWNTKVRPSIADMRDEFLPNKANREVGIEFNEPKITLHFSSTNPTRNYRDISMRPREAANKARFLGNEASEGLR